MKCPLEKFHFFPKEDERKFEELAKIYSILCI